MDLIKEFFEILFDAPGEIGDTLTPIGKWTIWIPLTISAMILITVLTIILGFAHLFDKVTNNFIPKQCATLMNKLFK